MFTVNSTSKLVDLIVADPGVHAERWAERLPTVLHGLRYVPDVIVGGQTRRTTYSLLYSDAGVPLPPEYSDRGGKEVRVLSLVAFTRVITRTLIDIVKLELPRPFYNWVRLVRDIDRISIGMLLVTFQPTSKPLGTAPPLEHVLAEAPTEPPTDPAELANTIDEVVFRITTETHWRLYKVDTGTRASYTFLHTCTAESAPCSCCRKNVPIVCSLQPPK